MLQVELVALDGRVLISTPAIVDSGADASTFPAEWAPKLGIDLIHDCIETPCGTAAGRTTGFVYPNGVDAWVLEERFPLSATFNHGLDVILLGRRDFFDWFRIEFDQRAKTFTVHPYEERPGDVPRDDDDERDAALVAS